MKNDSPLYFHLKDGTTTTRNGIKLLAENIKRSASGVDFLERYLSPDSTLVPVPRSAPFATAGSLWPSRRICDELCTVGLARDVLPVLKRISAVQKSSTARKGERPNPRVHFDSTRVNDELPLTSEKITLVDDFITRGSSLVGMFARLSSSFPDKQIRCFALVRTVSDSDIESLIAPVEGIIYLSSESYLRRVP